MFIIILMRDVNNLKTVTYLKSMRARVYPRSLLIICAELAVYSVNRILKSSKVKQLFFCKRKFSVLRRGTRGATLSLALK